MKTNIKHEKFTESYQAKVKIIELVHPFLTQLEETISQKVSTQRPKLTRLNLLHFSVSEYESIESFFYTISRHVGEISSEETINVTQWIHLIRLLRSCVEFFHYKKTMFREFYEVDKTLFKQYIKDVKSFMVAEKLDPIKNSWKYIEEFRNTPLEVRLTQDLEAHNHVIDSELEIDYSKYKDYILYSFDAIGTWYHFTGISDSLHKYISSNEIDLGYAYDILEQIPSEDLTEDMLAEDLSFGLEAIEIIYDPIKLSTKYLETFELDLDEIKINIDKLHFIKEYQKEISDSVFNYYVVNETVKLNTSISGELFANEEITVDSLREFMNIKCTKNELYYAMAYKNKKSYFIMNTTFDGYTDNYILTKKKLLSLKL